jgi:dCTP deaminase
MSLLSYNRLCELIEQGVIMNVPFENVNAASIDLTLGDTFMREVIRDGVPEVVSLAERKPLSMSVIEDASIIRLHPGEFILAQSQQIFNLPVNISGEYKLKSSMARIGLEHLNAGWCDAGWHGSVLTLEFKNMTRNHIIELQPGDKIGQIVLFEHEPVPEDKSYAARGRYNGDTKVSPIKE